MSYASTIRQPSETGRKRGGLAIDIALLSGTLLILQFLMQALADGSNILAFNALFCLLLLALTGFAAFRYVTLNRLFVLTPIPWFYVACGLFFGLGPLLWNFGDQATIAYVDQASRIPIDNSRILEANLLTIGGISLVTATLAALQFLFDWEGKAPRDYLVRFTPEALTRIFWAALIVGVATKYVLLFPLRLGIASYEVPNFISQLSSLLKVAIIVGYLARARGVRGISGMHFALIASELLTAAMSASKTELFTVILMVIIGSFLARRPLRNVVLIGLATALLYVGFLANFVQFVRMNYDVAGVTSVADLADATTEYLAADQVDSIGQAGVQLWWARLTMTNFQIFAIDSYHAGRPGDTLVASLWALVPRFLYPNKPDLNAGKLFSEELMTGSSEWVQTSMSYFAEGFWNGGVWGLIIVCCWAAFVYSVLTFILFANIAAGRIGVLLMASVAIPLGLGVEAWFASGLAGGFALALLYAAVGYGFDRLAMPRQPVRPMVRAFGR